MRGNFYAKVGDLNQKPYGGGEVGNRRTLKMLQEIGYDVRLIPRYYNYEEKSLWVFMKIIFGDILSLFRLAELLKPISNMALFISGCLKRR